MADVVRIRVVVHGIVQGVWFRESCRRRVEEVSGVAGWVRNRDDGTVEAAFEGEARSVSVMVAWCRMGPPRATVSGVDVTEEPPEGVVGFRVSR